MLKEKILRQWFSIEDIFFELKTGLNFSGNIAKEKLVTSFATKDSAHEYRPVYARNIRVLISEANKLGAEYHNFIDIGSGKGKACFYASQKNQFKNIIGVEFSEELVAIANSNKEIADSKNIVFLNEDATAYSLPKESSLIFLFNPFDESVLRIFIKNNLDHFRICKSVIAYANDVHRVVLSEFGFQTVFRDQDRKISLHHVSEI